MKIIAIFVVLCGLLYSHPHTFVGVYPTITVKNKFIQKVNFIWKLDKMTSSIDTDLRHTINKVIFDFADTDVLSNLNSYVNPTRQQEEVV